MFVDSTGTQGGVVVGAIRNAARATGADFQYLLATAQVESGLDPRAGASSSSAKGLFQFIDQTWLTTLKESGAALGYGRYVDAIVKTPSGHYTVTDPAMRREIMALRDDPAANAAMAGAFTQQNAAVLSQRIGRAPSEGELYLAHFFGAGGAAQLINRATQDPGASAPSVFPNAAKANPSIFYDRQGHARSLAGVYHVLVGRYDTARATPTDPAGSAVAVVRPPLDIAPPAAATIGPPSKSAVTASTLPVIAAANAPPQAAPRPAFRSLFRDDGQREPVSQFVRELWTSNPRVAAALTGEAGPPSSATPTATVQGGRMDLFSDRPSDVKSLFGART